MADPNPKFNFLSAVHALANAHDEEVVAYVVVGVLKTGEDLVLGTGSGSRLEAGSELEERVHTAMIAAFAKGLRIIKGESPDDKPVLLN